ncbi:MAG: nicotinate-nucleotide--dimethylbenzimidazole phosphoribosyltransferase, partial [Christensenellaceae bacterium]|nr:nicotinate-nucleotide--dimethylbenzimidazole phosphoribosyltransferase [Christensenellaceae bacterium]
ASALAAHVGSEVEVVDVGVLTDVGCAAVFNRKVAYGTNNIRRGAAMTRDQALCAMLTGVEFADKAAEDGVDIAGCGGMGIGNTTTTAAVLCVLTGKSAAEIAGKGGGITQEAYLKKIAVIDDAIALNAPDPKNVVEILAKVGGFDLCAMTGFFLGCAKNRIPVVVDGIISIVAALAAMRMQENVKDFLFLSHRSFEKGYDTAARELGLKEYLDMDMRLGEGSGCPLMFQVISAACAVMKNMATFAQAAINDDYLEEIRVGDCFTVSEE